MGVSIHAIPAVRACVAAQIAVLRPHSHPIWLPNEVDNFPAANRGLGYELSGRLLEVGREFGVKPVMEYLGFSEQVNSIEAALRVMRGAGQPDATIVLDPFHCIFVFLGERCA